MLNDEQREELRTGIAETLRSLADDITRMQELIVPVPPDNAIGRISRMEAISEKSVNEATLRSALARQARLQHTQTVVDDAEFGVCSQCDKDIPFARLKLVPESRLCVACAEANGR